MLGVFGYLSSLCGLVTAESGDNRLDYYIQDGFLENLMRTPVVDTFIPLSR